MCNSVCLMAHCKAKISFNAIDWVKFMEVTWFFIFTQLAYCIVQFLEKDPGLTEPVRIMVQLNPMLNLTLSLRLLPSSPNKSSVSHFLPPLYIQRNNLWPSTFGHFRLQKLNRTFSHWSDSSASFVFPFEKACEQAHLGVTRAGADERCVYAAHACVKHNESFQSRSECSLCVETT